MFRFRFCAGKWRRPKFCNDRLQLVDPKQFQQRGVCAIDWASPTQHKLKWIHKLKPGRVDPPHWRDNAIFSAMTSTPVVTAVNDTAAVAANSSLWDNANSVDLTSSRMDATDAPLSDGGRRGGDTTRRAVGSSSRENRRPSVDPFG